MDLSTMDIILMEWMVWLDLQLMKQLLLSSVPMGWL